MTCKLYNGRVLVILLVIFTLPRQTLQSARDLHHDHHRVARPPPFVHRLARPSDGLASSAKNRLTVQREGTDQLRW
jgi:hypothetical protein